MNAEKTLVERLREDSLQWEAAITGEEKEVIPIFVSGIHKSMNLLSEAAARIEDLEGIIRRLPKRLGGHNKVDIDI